MTKLKDDLEAERKRRLEITDKYLEVTRRESGRAERTSVQVVIDSISSLASSPKSGSKSPLDTLREDAKNPLEKLLTALEFLEWKSGDQTGKRHAGLFSKPQKDLNPNGIMDGAFKEEKGETDGDFWALLRAVRQRVRINVPFQRSLFSFRACVWDLIVPSQRSARAP